MQNRIKALRKTRGITQNKFCEYLAIAQPTLSGYETNTYEPDFETACKIADYFDVSVDYLLGREKRQQDNVLSTNAIISTTKNEIQALYDAMSPQQQNLLIAYGKGLLADSGVDFTRLA